MIYVQALVTVKRRHKKLSECQMGGGVKLYQDPQTENAVELKN